MGPIIEEKPLKLKKASKELRDFLKEAKSIEVPAETISQLKGLREFMKDALARSE